MNTGLVKDVIKIRIAILQRLSVYSFLVKTGTCSGPKCQGQESQGQTGFLQGEPVVQQSGGGIGPVQVPADGPTVHWCLNLDKKAMAIHIS